MSITEECIYRIGPKRCGKRGEDHQDQNLYDRVVLTISVRAKVLKEGTHRDFLIFTQRVHELVHHFRKTENLWEGVP